ncbi:MAG: BatD family protein, partial [Opitutales bacterium]
GSLQSVDTKSMPQVEGLQILNGPNRVQKTSIINGQPTVKQEVSFTVKPSRTGTFTMPRWPLSLGGQAIAIPAATLQTLNPTQEDQARAAIKKKQESEFKQALFLELSLSSNYLYEGQTIPASIDLFIWERLQPPRPLQMHKIGDAFSQSEVNRPPRKRNESRNGKTYVVHSWPVAITAAIKGKHDLQYKMVVSVRVNRQRNPNSNPFLSDAFLGFGREEAVQITSDKHSIEVRALPMNGLSDSFHGAIGSFQTQTSKDTSRVTVGDPIRMTFSVVGKGNFDVIPAPKLSSNDKIKIGPPAFLFKGDENMMYEGIQQFEYVVTPLSHGNLEIPPIPFSFFDPSNQTYVDASAPPQVIRVDPGEAWVDPNPTETTGTNNGQPTEQPRNLFQTEPEPGSWKSRLTSNSTFRVSTFWYIQAGPALCFFALAGWRFRANRSSKDSLARRLVKLRREMKDAIKSNDNSTFLRAARGSIQERVGSLVHHERPEALARDEVVEILRKKAVSDQILSEVREVLESVDASEFARDDERDLPLKEWFGRVNRLLKRIPSKA